MDLLTIHTSPTKMNDIHESVFRSYHILNKVLKMIDRGDSKETINEVVDYLRGKNIEEYFEEFNKLKNHE